MTKPSMNARRGPGWLSVVLTVALAIVASAAVVRPQGAPPRRIVSLVPAVTEMIFAIGGGGDVVGVSSYDAFPPEVAALPKVGALIDPDFERILSLRPDLVILYGSQDELAARLERVHVPAFRYRHAGLADVTATIRAVGTRIGRADAAVALARRLEADIEAIRRATAGRRPPATLLVFGRESGTLRGIHASGGIGFLHDMLVVAGGRDVLDDVARESLQMSVEVVLARAPEVIVEVYPSGGWTNERLARERAVWAGLPALPAVRTGRIHILADDRLLIPGPRVAAAIRMLAETLHPGGPFR